MLPKCQITNQVAAPVTAAPLTWSHWTCQLNTDNEMECFQGKGGGGAGGGAGAGAGGNALNQANLATSSTVYIVYISLVFSMASFAV